MLTQAGKDMVAQMLPMAQGSSDATAQLYALAQQAGYQGPDAFQSLVQWVGKTKDAEQNLENITGQLTIASANLATDVSNLAQALGGSLASNMQAAILQATGGRQAFDAFATAAIKSHDNLGQMRTSAQQLASQLISVLGNTTQAHDEFDTFAIAMHLTKQQADELWQSVQKVAQAESDIPKNVTSTITITEQLKQAFANANPKNQSLPGNTPGSVGAATGGLIRGGSGRPRADDIVARLSDNEYVIQEPAVRKYGVGTFDDLNAMRFADGGHVTAGGRPAAGGVAAEVPVIHNEFNYYGPQHPTPEMQQAMIMNLTRAVGMSG
jgi:hypothetical protein